MDEVGEFLESLGTGAQAVAWAQWLRVIPKPSPRFAPRVLILGDVGTGKSGLAYWLLEGLSKEYDMMPTVVGIPKDKRYLLPENFIRIEKSDLKDITDAVILIDEADLQLPFNDVRMVKEIINFLNLPRHRRQILLLAFHYPRLVRGTYLPSFSAFLLKQPPYLLEFAGKADSKELVNMMKKAEERFTELPNPLDTVKWTYVIAPAIRWQGLLQNELASFWSEELSVCWSGVAITQAWDEVVPQPPKLPLEYGERIGWYPLPDGGSQKNTNGDYFMVTGEMKRRKVKVETKEFKKSIYFVYKDPVSGLHWIERG